MISEIIGVVIILWLLVIGTMIIIKLLRGKP
jgi:hypothetical protein